MLFMGLSCIIWRCTALLYKISKDISNHWYVLLPNLKDD